MKTVELIQRKPESISKKRVAAYCRVSLESERMNHSLSAQVSYYSSLIQSNPLWEYKGVYSDEGISGTSVERKGLQSLLKECRKGKIDIILTKSISRLARNTTELLKITRELKDRNIEIRFEKENISTLSSDGELMLTLLASFAAEEALSVSQNTRWAISKRFEKGLESGSPVAFGYKRNENGEYTIDKKKAKVVRNIFMDYLDGLSPHRIAEKYSLSYSTIWQMLRNEKYKGDILLQKTYSTFDITHKSHTRKRNTGEKPRYYVKNSHPAIVSPAVFDTVQEMIKQKIVEGKVYKRNPFTSIITCSCCGRKYRRRKTDGKNGKHYWKCTSKIECKSCDSKNIDEEFLIALFKKYNREIISIKTDGREFDITLKGGKHEKCNTDTCKQ